MTGYGHRASQSQSHVVEVAHNSQYVSSLFVPLLESYKTRCARHGAWLGLVVRHRGEVSSWALVVFPYIGWQVSRDWTRSTKKVSAGEKRE